MNKIRKTINEILTGWGKSQQQAPLQSEVLKNEVLNKLGAFPQGLALPSRCRPWLSLAFAGMAVLMLLVSPPITKKTSILTEPAPMDGGRLPGYPSSGEMLKSSPREPMPYYPETPISDNREFLKTGYNATIRSRHIEESVQRIRIFVRGLGGRIDSASSSKRYGYVNFAVPADKFENLKNELKSVFGERYINENIQTENLLPQKKSIEQQQEYIQKTLNQLRTDRDQLKKTHTRTVASIKSQMDAIAAEITNLRAEVTTDPVRKQIIADRIQELLKKNNELVAGLNRENARYAENLDAYDRQIKDNESYLENVNKQDRDLLDTVATVRGSISLNWISVWEIVNLYLPAYWLAVIFSVLAVFSYFIYRRKNQLIIL